MKQSISLEAKMKAYYELVKNNTGVKIGGYLSAGLVLVGALT